MLSAARAVPSDGGAAAPLWRPPRTSSVASTAMTSTRLATAATTRPITQLGSAAVAAAGGVAGGRSVLGGDCGRLGWEVPLTGMVVPAGGRSQGGCSASPGDPAVLSGKSSPSSWGASGVGAALVEGTTGTLAGGVCAGPAGGSQGAVTGGKRSATNGGGISGAPEPGGADLQPPASQGVAHSRRRTPHGSAAADKAPQRPAGSAARLGNIACSERCSAAAQPKSPGSNRPRLASPARGSTGLQPVLSRPLATEQVSGAHGGLAAASPEASTTVVGGPLAASSTYSRTAGALPTGRSRTKTSGASTPCGGVQLPVADGSDSADSDPDAAGSVQKLTSARYATEPNARCTCEWPSALSALPGGAPPAASSTRAPDISSDAPSAAASARPPAPASLPLSRR
mmetsp:Transcript_4587/g.11789  ORF Transcript_4587/g.11789 Transcript_4587/m.11789 type:complete len:399 (+) Transcript_4587:840-2036(+)